MSPHALLIINVGFLRIETFHEKKKKNFWQVSKRWNEFQGSDEFKDHATVDVRNKIRVFSPSCWHVRCNIPHYFKLLLGKNDNYNSDHVSILNYKRLCPCVCLSVCHVLSFDHFWFKCPQPVQWHWIEYLNAPSQGRGIDLNI